MEELKDLLIETMRKQIELDTLLIHSLKKDYDRLLTLFKESLYETQKKKD